MSEGAEVGEITVHHLLQYLREERFVVLFPFLSFLVSVWLIIVDFDLQVVLVM